jgi:hypothetical protein
MQGAHVMAYRTKGSLGMLRRLSELSDHLLDDTSSRVTGEDNLDLVEKPSALQARNAVNETNDLHKWVR